MMVKLSHYFAHTTTVPAVILNIYSLVVENVNVLLLVAVSAVSLIFWLISIKNKRIEILKNRQEIEAFKAQEDWYKLQCKHFDCPKKEE